MIDVQDLSKRFTQGRGRKARTVEAVKGLSFRAADGCITGLLGPNGAGKTTTLRMVAALIAPDAGRIQVDGIDVAAQPQEALARMGLTSMVPSLPLPEVQRYACLRYACRAYDSHRSRIRSAIA